MEASPIERAVTALEKIAESLGSIDSALHNNKLKCIAQIIEEELTNLGREISCK